jgi:hypothetical protein
MRRPHRRAHRRIWFVLPCVIGLLFAAALVLRPAPPVGALPLVSGAAR